MEQAGSKLKAYLQRVGARTKDALEEALAQGVPLISHLDAQAWFKHRGYLPSRQLLSNLLYCGANAK